MKKILNNKKLMNTIIVLTILYFDAVMTNGVLAPVYDVCGYIPLVILIVSFLILSSYKEGVKFYLRKDNYIIGFMIVLTIIPYFIKQDIYLFYLTCELTIFGIMFNIFKYCKKNNSKKENYILASIVLMNFLLSYVASLYYLSIDSWIIRISAHESKETIKALLGTKTVYMLGTISTSYGALVVTYLAISKILKKNYYWLIILIISLGFYLRSDLFIGLISFFSGLLIYIFLLCRKKIGTIKSTLLFIFIGLSGITVLLFANYFNLLPRIMSIRVTSLIDALRYNTLDFEALYRHANDWVKGLVPKGDISDLEARIITYTGPIVGIIENRFIYNPFNVLVSSHTTVLDVLSLYGFLSLLLFYWFYITLREIYIEANDKYIFVSIVVYFFVACLLNANLTIDHAVLIYFVAPFILTAINYEEK